MAQRIDGKALAARYKAEAAAEAAALREKGVQPRLAVVLAGEDPASKTYVAGKARDCAECGILSDVIELPEQTGEQELLARVAALNTNRAVHGVLVQLPLPAHISTSRVIHAIAPEKDVDGFTPVNVGRMVLGEECFLPCTPAGCLAMLQSTGVPLAGKDAVVIGRSNIVGKPMALLLTAQDVTVTLCHSHTEHLREKCAAADILIAAVGRAGFVTADMVKPGAIVIDVGINRGTDGRLCGDVDFAAANERASFITPVPGGVGLMTRAMLMHNTVKAARLQSAAL